MSGTAREKRFPWSIISSSSGSATQAILWATDAEAISRMISRIFREEPLLKYWSSNLISTGCASDPVRIADSFSMIGSKDAMTFI